MPRLDGLVQKLLAVGQQAHPLVAEVNLQVFLNAAVAAHQDAAQRKRITLYSDAQEKTGYFDREQLGRAVDNLILNALKAAPAESRVTIVARKQENRLLVSVHDQGTGPSAEIAPRLFEPFVTGYADGTGLGLSIVREIAQAHGGAVSYAHDADGTTFTLELPWRAS